MRPSIHFSYCVLPLMAEGQQPLNILIVGDSLTAGYYNHGKAFHSYAIYLKQLFECINIPVKIKIQGWCGGCVVYGMVEGLQRLLKQDPSYDWVIILGGTNDITNKESVEQIFNDGLQPMYEICLNHPGKKIKLAVMTVMEVAGNPTTHDRDQVRQKLNTMIRDYVHTSNEQDRICLVDLANSIPYHSMTDLEERKQIWDDGIHLKPAGYDRIAKLVFDTIKTKL